MTSFKYSFDGWNHNLTAYEELGLKEDANEKEIRKAYLNQAKKYHPDKAKEEAAHLKFQNIAGAYDILSNQDKRRAYDDYLKFVKQTSRPSSRATDFSSQSASSTTSSDSPPPRPREPAEAGRKEKTAARSEPSSARERSNAGPKPTPDRAAARTEAAASSRTSNRFFQNPQRAMSHFIFFTSFTAAQRYADKAVHTPPSMPRFVFYIEKTELNVSG